MGSRGRRRKPLHSENLMSEHGTGRFFAAKLLSLVLFRKETAPDATLLLRIMAGSVFLWEGILKFVYPNQGVGRFTKLGMPFPAVTAGFVGTLEIVGGSLLLLGLATRLVAIPLGDRDGRRDPVHQDLALSRSLAASASTGPAYRRDWAVLDQVRSRVGATPRLRLPLPRGARPPVDSMRCWRAATNDGGPRGRWPWLP